MYAAKSVPAVVFVQRMENGKPVQEGYCLTCARAMHIQPVDDLMKQFGMSDQDLENMEERMGSFLQEAADSGMLAPTGGGQPGRSPRTILCPAVRRCSPLAWVASARTARRPRTVKRRRGPAQVPGCLLRESDPEGRDGKTDRIIGRDREIYRTIQILCRRQKNNPCLIGEAGRGQDRHCRGHCPTHCRGQGAGPPAGQGNFLLDMTALIAGTQFRGQFEQRVKGLISEVKAAGNIILFIDEIHSIVGAGDSEGAMNAANIMKPALSRGQVQVIGATPLPNTANISRRTPPWNVASSL